jgi:DNA-binding transcriptional LysR family regulator
MLDWDDLRFVLAVARVGSALRAARVLMVNQTTVTRRIAHIEGAIGASLFEARRSGYRLTPLGETVAASAARIEAEVGALETAVASHLRAVVGAIRFTSSESLASWMITPFLRRFQRQFPAITVEVIADDRRFDLARGEADVALRAGSRPEGGGIVAQRLPDIAWATYCSRAYAEDHGLVASLRDLAAHAIVGLDGPMARIPQFLWLTNQAPNARISTRSNNLSNFMSAVKAGLGIGMLPCFIADGDDELVRCLPPVQEVCSELWLIVREELRQAPHIRAFVDALAHDLAARRAELSGEIDKRNASGGQSALGALAVPLVVSIGNLLATATVTVLI